MIFSEYPIKFFDKSASFRTFRSRNLQIFASGELIEEVVISKMEATTKHDAMTGKTQTKETKFYNLDSILSVGYRVNSKNASAFRIWANKVLKQDLLQGYAINERIASQKFDELSQLVKVLGRTIRKEAHGHYCKI